MVALGTPEATLAAMAYASKFLSEGIRAGASCAIFECSGVEIIATIEEDGEDWNIMLECCSADAIRRNEKTCHLYR